MAIVSRLARSGDYETPEDLVEDALTELEPLFEAVAERCASLSATSYDILRASAVGEAIGATPYPDRDAEWTRRALHAIAAQSKDIEAFRRSVASRLDYEAKRASGSTMFSNGVDDPAHPRYARVPTGTETCPFCIMLASRGFVYYSERTAGKLDHYHPNCDCRVVPKFGSESYEGYDPDDYLRQYEKLIDGGKLDVEALSRSARREKQRRKATPRKWDPNKAVKDGDAIAGVAKGEPMNFERANHRRANPYAMRSDAAQAGYRTNCQTCVVVNELRRRGYDLEARNRGCNAEQTMKDLARDSRIAWLTKDGRRPSFTKIYKAPTIAEQRKLVENVVEPGKRYTFSFCWKAQKGKKPSAHIVCLDRDDLGNLRLYCPQTGHRYIGKSLDNYLKRIEFANNAYLGKDKNGVSYYGWNPQIMRVDDLDPVANVVNAIARKATT